MEATANVEAEGIESCIGGVQQTEPQALALGLEDRRDGAIDEQCVAGHAHHQVHHRCRIGEAAIGIEGAVLYDRSEEHTSELQSLMRISYAVFCLKKKKQKHHKNKENRA